MPWAQHSVLPSAHTHRAQIHSGYQPVFPLSAGLELHFCPQFDGFNENCQNKSGDKNTRNYHTREKWTRVGGRARVTGREKNCLCTKVTQGHETIRFAVFLVWFGVFCLFGWSVFSEDNLSFHFVLACSAYFTAPQQGTIATQTSQRCEINALIFLYGFIK